MLDTISEKSSVSWHIKSLQVPGLYSSSCWWGYIVLNDPVYRTLLYCLNIFWCSPDRSVLSQYPPYSCQGIISQRRHSPEVQDGIRSWVDCLQKKGRDNLVVEQWIKLVEFVENCTFSSNLLIKYRSYQFKIMQIFIIHTETMQKFKCNVSS